MNPDLAIAMIVQDMRQWAYEYSLGPSGRTDRIDLFVRLHDKYLDAEASERRARERAMGE